MYNSLQIGVVLRYMSTLVQVVYYFGTCRIVSYLLCFNRLRLYCWCRFRYTINNTFKKLFFKNGFMALCKCDTWLPRKTPQNAIINSYRVDNLSSTSNYHNLIKLPCISCNSAIMIHIRACATLLFILGAMTQAFLSMLLFIALSAEAHRASCYVFICFVFSQHVYNDGNVGMLFNRVHFSFWEFSFFWFIPRPPGLAFM